MLAFFELLDLVSVLKVIHAHAALIEALGSVIFEAPGNLRNSRDFSLLQPRCHFPPIFFFELQKLLVCHIVRIEILDASGLATFFESFLEHFFFGPLCMEVLSHFKHVSHHQLQHDISFFFPLLQLLTRWSRRNLVFILVGVFWKFVSSVRRCLALVLAHFEFVGLKLPNLTL